MFSIKMEPDKVFELRFADHGVPADARLLVVNYTPQGGPVFPVELHGNRPLRHSIPPVVHLYGRVFPKPEAEAVGTTEIAISVTWVAHGPDAEVWQSLTDAAEAYTNKRLEATVVPANAAVEDSVRSLLTDFFGRFGIPSKRVGSFLSDGATYSHQLNVLVPALVSVTGAPVLADSIRGALNRLNSLRNDVAHSGRFEAAVTPEQIGECLAAAIFGVHYSTAARAALLGT